MLMPQKNRQLIFQYLFKEGVCVAKKDFHQKLHPHIEGVSSLHVIKALQSLVSKGYVTERFAWRHYYWYLTDEGINYLREYLHLPPEIVPSTLKRQARAEPTRGAAPPGGARPDYQRKPMEHDRQAYRGAEGGTDKTAEAGAGRMDFRGGFGGGAPTGFGRGKPM